MFKFIKARLWKRTAAPAASDASRDLGGDEEPKYRPIEWPLIKRLFSLLAPYKKRYAMGVSLGILMIFLEMLSPRYIAHLVDYTTSFADGKLGGISESSAIRHVVGVVALWALTFGVA